MYRLHIDIPMGMDQEEAIRHANHLMQILRDAKITANQINYRLGNDEDRQRSNYLDINKNGHCSAKKCIL